MTEDVITKILNALKTGCTRQAAYTMAGISHETFYNAMGANLEFRESVIRAEAEAEGMFTAVIAKAAHGTKDTPGDWRAAESWLKRRRRGDYGDSVDIRKLDDETLLRLLGIAEGSAEAWIDSEPLAITSRAESN